VSPDSQNHNLIPITTRSTPGVTIFRPWYETRSAAGKQARDTFLSLLKTCSKLAISFWDYLGARLKIPDTDIVPWLSDLIRQNAPV